MSIELGTIIKLVHILCPEGGKEMDHCIIRLLKIQEFILLLPFSACELRKGIFAQISQKNVVMYGSSHKSETEM